MINVMVSKKAAKLGVSAEAGLVVLAKEHGIGTGPSRYRSLSLSPRRARPPATTRAIQLAHIGIDQSPMVTVHSIKIRTRWNSATTAKITPATRENVFAFMRHHPRGRRLRTSSERFGSLTLRVTSAAIPQEPGTTATPTGDGVAWSE